MKLLAEQAGLGRSVGVVALLAGSSLHRVTLVGRLERDVDLVALGAALADRAGRQGVMIRGVGLVAGAAVALGERRVLYRLLLPLVDADVAAGAQVGGRSDQKFRVRPAVRGVTVHTAAVGHRLVHHRPVEFQGQILMAGQAQRAGPVLQKMLESGDMGVVAGAAFTSGGRGVGDRGFDLFRQTVMADQADLALVDIHRQHGGRQE